MTLFKLLQFKLNIYCLQKHNHKKAAFERTIELNTIIALSNLKFFQNPFTFLEKKKHKLLAS